jgi:hypothetical protein
MQDARLKRAALVVVRWWSPVSLDPWTRKLVGRKKTGVLALGCRRMVVVRRVVHQCWVQWRIVPSCRGGESFAVEPRASSLAGCVHSLLGMQRVGVVYVGA